MVQEKVDLYAYFGVPKNGRAGELSVLAPAESHEVAKKSRPAVLIIPGGGYQCVSEREGEPVAVRFLAEGYATFTLTYTIRTAYPVPLIEAAMAMAYIRREYKKYGADPAKVAVVGFSAGGHLAGMLTAMYEDENLSFLHENVRPDASLLCYAVLTTDGDTHADTAKVISGGDGALREKLSLADRFTGACPPVFLWHTSDDGAVPVQNSLRAAQRLAEQKVPFELHVFAHGIHGLAVSGIETADDRTDLDRINPSAAQWLPLAFVWLRGLGFEVKRAEE